MVNLEKEFPQFDKKYLNEIDATATKILEYPDYLKNKDYIQHGRISIYEHSIMVTIQCLKIADKFKHIDRQQLIIAALLHDYFKYDWHIYSKENGLHKLHGFYHPTYAANNALKDFNITEKEVNIIKAHMWPLGFDFPKSKEAWILFMADKISALSETLTMR